MPAANLGGRRPATAQSGMAVAEADLLTVYRDNVSRQWRCTVRLEGGRVVEGVRFLYPSSREAVGVRPFLPAPDERGLVLWPSANRQSRHCYWIGSLDIYTYGPDVDSPDEVASVHPSGQAAATDPLGNSTYRYPAGDTLLVGDPAIDEYQFKHRVRGETLARVEGTGTNSTDRSRWYFKGLLEGKFFGARLKHGDAQLWIDRDDGEFYTRTWRKDDGETQVHGTMGDLLLKSERFPPGRRSHSLADLDGDSPKITLESQSPQGLAVVVIDGATGDISLHATRNITIHADQIVHIDAGKWLRLTAPLITLN